MSPDTPPLTVRARAYMKTPEFSKLWRYGTVSVISTVISLGGLYIFFRVLKIGSAEESNAIASMIATVPSYYLNRTWAWGKTGKSHLMREVVPFWVIAIISVFLSSVAVNWADHETKAHFHSHTLETIIVELANLTTYGIIWVGKFILFNKVLFAKPELESTPEPAVAG